MRFQNKPWLVLALIAAATLIALYAIDAFRHRVVRSESDLIGLLPANNATVFYARVDLLRRTGLLKLLAGSHDPEYRAFVLATNFDYSKDLNSIAGSAAEDNVFLAATGRFDWAAIVSYVRQQGGACQDEACQIRGATPGTWIGIVEIQPDVIGVALGKQKTLVNNIHPGQLAMSQPLPGDPVWVSVAPSLLKNPAALPPALRMFALALQPASSALLALGAAPGGSSAAFELKLNADCPSAVTADTIRKQLDIDTKLLNLELAHEHEKANPADLTGLLVSGAFKMNGKEVRGTWPISKQLLATLQQ